MNNEFFKISSELKNLIGKDLITDKNIAVFELVKNSFDANATEVKIRFNNLYGEDPCIIISDDGKGMSYDDLINKWLFVGFSGKRDGTEDLIDENERGKDYRHRISQNKSFAGSKGVGRFSCDRLGSRLKLITVKNAANKSIESLEVNWRSFEKDQNIEFKDVPIKHSSLPSLLNPIKHGTILEIYNITKEWDRDALLSLKDKLSKLIKPQNSLERNSERRFSITLDVPDEMQRDLEVAKSSDKGEGWTYYNTVNGEIKNFIFDQLGLKTTRIETSIIDDGKNIKTDLIDRNQKIYSIIETNPFNYLQNININLYFLNRSAKATFTQKMGTQPINYGNVFIYKNGFRVYPFGESRDDSLGIDARGTQGYARNLQTRNLMGQIEIYNKNDTLKEVTSRDGGFVKNSAYFELLDLFFEKAFKRLEKFVVDVAEWGVDDENLKELSQDNIKKNLVKLISNISDERSIIHIEYNKDIIEIVSNQEEKSIKKIVNNFRRIARDSDDISLLNEAKKIENIFNDFSTLKKSTERELEIVRTEKRAISQQLDLEKQKNNYFSATRKLLSKDAEGLIHNVKINALEIDERIIKILREIKANKLNQNQIISEISKLKYFSKKIVHITKLVTRADFNNNSEKESIDIVEYINEYLDSYNEIYDRDSLEFIVESSSNRFTRFVSKLDLAIILDDLINNSLKAGAKKIKVTIENTVSNAGLDILFSDDGDGLDRQYLNSSNSIFELGITSTTGSGIGLHTVREKLGEMKADIEFVGNGILLRGACFKIQFRS
jgi:signal transduction histidine kinase